MIYDINNFKWIENRNINYVFFNGRRVRATYLNTRNGECRYYTKPLRIVGDKIVERRRFGKIRITYRGITR